MKLVAVVLAASLALAFSEETKCGPYGGFQVSAACKDLQRQLEQVHNLIMKVRVMTLIEKRASRDFLQDPTNKELITYATSLTDTMKGECDVFKNRATVSEICNKLKEQMEKLKQTIDVGFVN